MKSTSIWQGLAALLAFASVGFGAFGAHGAADAKSAEWLRTGAEYGLIHCLACFVAALAINHGHHRAKAVPAFFLTGVLLFSGSLFAMALGAPRVLGAVAPIGGLSFLIGWAVLALAYFTPRADG